MYGLKVPAAELGLELSAAGATDAAEISGSAARDDSDGPGRGDRPLPAAACSTASFSSSRHTAAGGGGVSTCRSVGQKSSSPSSSDTSGMSSGYSSTGAAAAATAGRVRPRRSALVARDITLLVVPLLLMLARCAARKEWSGPTMRREASSRSVTCDPACPTAAVLAWSPSSSAKEATGEVAATHVLRPAMIRWIRVLGRSS
jgi:hypothetical protein